MPPGKRNEKVKFSQTDEVIIQSSKFKQEFVTLKKIINILDFKKVRGKANEATLRLLNKLKKALPRMNKREKLLYKKLIAEFDKQYKNVIGLRLVAVAWVLYSDKEDTKRQDSPEFAKFIKELKKQKWNKLFTKETFIMFRDLLLYSPFLKGRKGRPMNKAEIKKTINDALWDLNKHCWKVIVEVQQTRNYTKAKKLLAVLDGIKYAAPPICSPKYWQTINKTKRIVGRYAAKAKAKPEVTKNLEKNPRIVKFKPRE